MLTIILLIIINIVYTALYNIICIFAATKLLYYEFQGTDKRYL